MADWARAGEIEDEILEMKKKRGEDLDQN